MSRLSQWVSIGVLACIAGVAASAEAAPKKKKRPTQAKIAKTEEAAPEFDKQAAISAIGEINLQKCKATNAAKGEGHVTITFAPAGFAESALVDKGPWLGTPVAKCMAREFKKAKVPAFRGDPVTVGKSFQFE